MEIRTHNRISGVLVGTPVEVVGGSKAIVELTTTPEMEADISGLTHGGFTFSLADYAAMLAVNHPNVVLGSAQTKFLAPVETCDKMRAEAIVKNTDGRKSEVNVDVTVDGKVVFTGTFQCYSLEKHVLTKIK